MRWLLRAVGALLVLGLLALGLLALVLPDVDRDHARQDVDAGGEPIVDEPAADPLGLRTRWEGRIYQDWFILFHCLRPPSRAL